MAFWLGKPPVILKTNPEDAYDVYCTLKKSTNSIEAMAEIQEWRRRKVVRNSEAVSGRIYRISKCFQRSKYRYILRSLQ
jgi:hypothetical protein